jgi:hypothetical protein
LAELNSLLLQGWGAPLVRSTIQGTAAPPSRLPGVPWSLSDVRNEVARREPASPRQPDLLEYLIAQPPQGMVPPPAVTPASPADAPPPPSTASVDPDVDYNRRAGIADSERALAMGMAAPRPRPRPPVVTPANSVPGPAAPQMPAQAADPAQQVQAAAQQAAAQGNNTLADRLMAFGFAMAASRNPSLFGQIGEAGQQVLQQRRQESQDDLQRRQVDGQLDYQQARVRLMQAEMDWSRDPTNPQNIQRLAAARAAMTSAGQASQDRDPLAARETDRDGNVFGITRSGRSVPLTDPQGRPFQPGRDETQDANTRRQLYATAYAQAWQSLAPDPMNPGASRLTPEERQQRAHAVAQQAVQGAMGVTGIQRGQQGGTQVQAPPPVNTGPRVVIGLDGQPIR